MRKKGFKHSEETKKKMSLSAIGKIGHKQSEKQKLSILASITKHGMCKTKTYSTWQSMKFRCSNKNHRQYCDYGGRGIMYCVRWESFENFFEDMGERPEGMTLDRIDNSKGYSKENCRWATEKEQKRNTRRNHFIEFRGEKRCLVDWAKSIGIKSNTLINRLTRSKWSIEKALTTPRFT